jgi:hypothetical protein
LCIFSIPDIEKSVRYDHTAAVDKYVYAKNSTGFSSEEPSILGYNRTKVFAELLQVLGSAAGT